jgi:hypothetical protein
MPASIKPGHHGIFTISHREIAGWSTSKGVLTILLFS